MGSNVVNLTNHTTNNSSSAKQTSATTLAKRKQCDLDYSSGDDSSCSGDDNMPCSKRKKPSESEHEPWTSMELSALRRATISATNNPTPTYWKTISLDIPARSPEECELAWHIHIQPFLKKTGWTPSEDNLLLQIALPEWTISKASGARVRWSSVAKSFAGRTGKQCRERWMNHVNPELKRGNWTKQEDKILLQQGELNPNRWALMARLLPGRTENMVKTRYKSITRSRRENKTKTKFSTVFSNTFINPLDMPTTNPLDMPTANPLFAPIDFNNFSGSHGIGSKSLIDIVAQTPEEIIQDILAKEKQQQDLEQQANILSQFCPWDFPLM